jgi:hypothetical protein
MVKECIWKKKFGLKEKKPNRKRKGEKKFSDWKKSKYLP